MNIWLLHVGEELPVDENPRLFRYGYLAKALAARGHTVLRWAPTFQHFRKHQRFDSDRRVDVDEHYAIQFVHAPGYKKNVSFARWRSYRTLGRRLREQLESQTRPDVIVTGIPSLEWCEVAVEYGQRHKVPVVLDVRDLWPDVYLHLLPKALRRVGKVAIEPIRRRVRRICRSATAMYGVSQSYLNWGIAHANRHQGDVDQVIPLGYQPKQLSTKQLEDELSELRSKGLTPNKQICLFAGLVERLYDVETILSAAHLLEAQHPGRYQFVICGDGSKASEIRRRASQSNNVLMLGWVSQSTIAALMTVAQVGLATYSADATQSLPNKPFEYMSGELAIVTSLAGELPELLQEHEIGTTYEAANANELARAIMDLTTDPRRLAHMQANSRRLFERRYDASTVSSQFCRHLELLVDIDHKRSREQAA